QRQLQIEADQQSKMVSRVENWEEVISRLGLQELCPTKFTIADAICLSSSKEHKHQTEKDLAFAFLQKLLMLDYRVRHLTVREESNAASNGKDRREEIPGKDMTDLFNFFSNEKTGCDDTHTTQEARIHPMDVQMAVFQCADSFLRQYMVTKLSQCQYALPLLVPNPVTAQIELPLWTFRLIRKSWKSTDGSSRDVPVYKTQTPMVSVFRLGSVSSSKSQLLNSLINRRHDTFFHRHCPGSSRSRLLLDGVVEIAWYCPAGRNDDVFDDCVAFCNLRGDAGEHQQQREFMVQAATVNVVLVKDFNLDDKLKNILQQLLKSPKSLICLLTEDDRDGKNENKFKIGLKDRSQAEITEELIKTIKTCLTNHSFSLEQCPHLMKNFTFDEKSEDCQTGKCSAEELMQLLKTVKLSQIKEKILPCQERLWRDWCQKSKELHLLNGDIEQTRSNIEQEMESIRSQQRDCNLSDLMKTFIRHLQSKTETQKMYFLNWLGIFIDDHGSDQLSKLHQKYTEKWLAVKSLKQEHNKSDALKRNQNELEEISVQLDASYLGLEHILREMGQIYEAWEYQPGAAELGVYSFPALAADLLISGFPVELMDGDAAHIPLKWIDSVLGKVMERLGDQRMFVLSVLGLQSSGKSTLLNAMFGLQFPVSAGRCTRGAFMQLVRVKEEKQNLRFDYLLVIDTEGLRAPRLAGKSAHKHDNELATFVIGLGNMTLINIMGENTAEMQDILQIAVQAFLRMKQVRLTPNCMFVHQNVTDITAGEKNIEGRRRLQETLDEMAQIAAKEEEFDVENFNDVIRFDVEKDVQYFAQLWEGNPPMAPPNPRYSENVQELKHRILSAALEQKSLNLSEFKTRIQDLWEALLNEDFVFSFKNTLEILVFRKLELMYENWTWQLRESVLAIDSTLFNRIENGELVNVDGNSLSQKINGTYDGIKQDMEKHFAEDKNKEILAQWKAKTEQNFDQLKKELIEGSKTKFDEVVQLKARFKELEDKKTHYESELFNRSKQMASTLRDKDSDEEELQRAFDSMWETWVSDLTADIPPVKVIHIEKDVMRILTDCYGRQLIQARKDLGHYKKICYSPDYSDCVKKHLFRKACDYVTRSNILKPEEQQSIRALTQDITREVEEYIKKKRVNNFGYSDNYICETVNTVKNKIVEFETKTKRIMFIKDFKVDLCLYVCDIAVEKFSELHSAFREANDPLIYLSSKRADYNSIFRKFCQGATSTTVFADFICSKLKPSILQAVYDKTAIAAAGEMRASFPAFSGNRSDLEKHMLLQLAEEEDFDMYMKYIHNPVKHFKEFITQNVKKHIFKDGDSSMCRLLTDNLTLVLSCVDNAVKMASEHVKNSENSDVEMWLNTFSTEIRDELKFTEKALRGVQYQDIRDFDFLQEEMVKDLQKVTEDLIDGFRIFNSSFNMNMFREKPDEILFRQLSRCWAQCPFCKAICTQGVAGHPGDHSVSFHRPSGVNGCRWGFTGSLISYFCSSSVASLGTFKSNGERFLYKNYRRAGGEFAEWSITPDSGQQLYWKWFVSRFEKDLEKHYSSSFGLFGIPKVWKKITKEDAIRSLK
ncbi:GVIN1 GTPase, partial [Amia calva]|nr:GVIN1 GTPase [Amia calva]